MVVKIPRRFTTAKLTLSIAAGIAALASTPVLAFSIETGNPDARLRWDTTVRYNLGWRMEEVNPHFADAFGSDETETRFKKHDLITNRLDVFSEADYSVQSGSNTYGARVSAALWSENAYPATSHTGDRINATFPGAFAVPSNYGPSAQYSRYAKRYVTGTSGEFLDAFVSGSFELAGTTLNLKLGQHNVYWGEAMFTIADGVSAGQGPLDTIKAATSPGAEAKELFMPLKQLSAQWTLSPEWSLMAQYQLDWKPYRIVSGGTYFAAADGAGNGFGADPMCASTAPGGTCIPSLDAITPKRKRGDYGLAVRWTPAWLDGTAGLYYRKYDEKLPWAAIQLQGGNPLVPGSLGLRLSYARDTEMLGVSLQKNFAAVSTGLEFSYRRNTALNSIGGFFAGSQGTSGVTDLSALFGLPPGSAVSPNYFLTSAANIPLTQTPTYEQVEGARGNTYHFVLNGVILLDKTSLWETGNLSAELAYQRLDKVTKNPNVYYATDYACRDGFLPSGIMAGSRGKSDGCTTKDSLAFNVLFNPQWMAVLPSVDLTMPISLSYGLRGNSPTLGGSNEGAYRWSIGLTAVYKTLYELGIMLSDQHQDYKTTPASLAAGNGVPGQAVMSTGNGSTQVQNNHRWLSLRFKTTF